MAYACERSRKGLCRNYLGSINHSLLTAEICKKENIEVMGWVFNDQYLDYEEEISRWSGYPIIGSIPFYAESPSGDSAKTLDKAFIQKQALLLKHQL